MPSAIRITVHGLTAVERELLDGLFAKAGGIADDSFSIAAFACAAARNIRAYRAVAVTVAGLVVELESPHGE